VRSEAWLWLIAGVVGVSLVLHEGELFVLAAILLLTVGVSRAWEHYSLTGLSYQRSIGQQRAFFGEQVPFTIELVNAKPLPLAWVEVEDVVPGAPLQLQPAHTTPSHIARRRVLRVLVSMRWFERLRRRYTVRCDARGLHAFGPAVLRTGDIFGFGQQEMYLPSEDYLLVYPKIVSLDRLGLPSNNPFGDRPVHRQWLFEDPLRTIGVRDYRPGDSPRRLHWKASARAPAQRLQVKLFEPTTTHRIQILLNVSTSERNWAWQGYDPDALEAAITTAASVASWATERGMLVGIAANAQMFHSTAALRLLPSRDPHQLMHILEALARLIPMASMSPEGLVEIEGRELAYGTTVVMVSAVADERLFQQLRMLKRGGHRPILLLITSADAPSAALDGLPAYAIRIEDTR
jgi:uncharacterized protein (DUF58 family)